MTEGYVTLAQPATAELEVKHSRFLARLEPVQHEAAARAVVEEARREHWDARHHCSAFVLGPRGDLVRSSDDGEPSGTAGQPILQTLQGAGITDVVAVVTRYFGGTLLGAGGLVRAYSGAVAAALEDAQRASYELRRLYALHVAHADAGRLESELRRLGFAVVDTRYGADVELTIGTPPADAKRLGGLVAEATGGAARPEPAGERWVRVEPV